MIISRKHPESLDFEKSSGENERNIATVDAMQEVEKVSIDAGLDHFQLVPRDANGKPKLSGLELFNHACRYRNTNVAADTTDGKQVRLAPMEGLDVALYEDSLECMQPTELELRRGAVIRESFGDRAKRKCAKRKLTALGTVVGHCGVVNSEVMMERMREQLAFAASQAEVENLRKRIRQKKRVIGTKNTKNLFPKAAQKLEKLSRNIAGLYTKEIEAILYSVYNKTVFGSKLRKPYYVKALEKELLANANKYETLSFTLAVQVVVPVEATVEAPPPTAVAAAPVTAPAAATV